MYFIESIYIYSYIQNYIFIKIIQGINNSMNE